MNQDAGSPHSTTPARRRGGTASLRSEWLIQTKQHRDSTIVIKVYPTALAALWPLFRPQNANGNRRRVEPTAGFPDHIEAMLLGLRQWEVTLQEKGTHPVKEDGSAFPNTVTSPEEFQSEIHGDSGRTCLTAQMQEL